jgi:predicted O-methyltransferase YrrM
MKFWKRTGFPGLFTNKPTVMSTTDDALFEYARQYSSAEDEVLAALNRETHLRTVYPNMLSGHLQGRFLEMISRLLAPRRILEIGTFTGYSAICMARGLTNDGLLHTIDINDETMEIAKKYIHLAGLDKKIILHTGNALDIITGLQEVYDLVFIDADKAGYISYYNAVFDNLRIGGVILADNVFWGGKVLEENKYPDRETKGILDFNTFVSEDEHVEKVMIPLRDGLLMIRKVSER